MLRNLLGRIFKGRIKKLSELKIKGHHGDANLEQKYKYRKLTFYSIRKKRLGFLLCLIYNINLANYFRTIGNSNHLHKC